MKNRWSLGAMGSKGGRKKHRRKKEKEQLDEYVQDWKQPQSDHSEPIPSLEGSQKLWKHLSYTKKTIHL